MTDPADLLVRGLATYRLTRLAVKDEFPPVARPRQAIQRWADRHGQPWLYDLTDCHWCASGWVALAVVTASDRGRWRADPAGQTLAWLAAWAVGALIAQAEPEK